MIEKDKLTKAEKSFQESMDRKIMKGGFLNDFEFELLHNLKFKKKIKADN